MSNENKNEFRKCNELAEKLEASVKDNERLAKTIRDLRQQNDDLQTQWRNRPSSSNESRLGTTGDDSGYKERFEALVEINHGWKKDYEELQMHFEMLSGEKRLLEDEKRKLKGRINELEKRQKSLEDEAARLAGALDARQASDGGASSSEEQCELLKLQIVVYKEDFERERQDCENLNEEKEKYKHKLEDAEEIVRKLTAELDACKALEQARWERGTTVEMVTSVTGVASPVISYNCSTHTTKLMKDGKWNNIRWPTVFQIPATYAKVFIKHACLNRYLS